MANIWTVARALALAATLAACGDGGAGGRDAAVADAATGPDAGLEARIDALIAAMSLGEKAALMHGSSPVAVDGLWPTAGNDRLGLPGFRMVDGPRGVSASTGPATAFPVGMARGATWDPSLEQRVGEAIALEARARGATVLLAPTVNVLRHPRWGRAQETYGEDPLHIGLLGAAFVRGAQRHLAAAVKHFAANSIEDSRFQVSVRIDERTLREVYLPQFERIVREADARIVMSSYNRVNGVYAAENEHLLSDILKRDWGFTGLVVSDWLLGTRSTVASALAGLDLEMPTGVYYGGNLIAAVRDGQLPEAVIDEHVRRILRVMLERPPSEPPSPDVIGRDEHRALAREVAAASMVLLRNEGAALPLAGELRVAVVGALADVANLGDRGSSNVEDVAPVTPQDGLVERLGAAAVVAVPTDTPSDAELAAIAAADAAVVIVGLTFAEEGENVPGSGGDRESLALPPAQVALIRAVAAANPRTVVVLEAGAAVLVEDWIDDVAALVMAWYPGGEGGRALADVLLGVVDACGRLPITFPVAEDQLPTFDNASAEVSYGYDHGYRYFDRAGAAPRFPFGFGLSYTELRYDALALDAGELGSDGSVTATVDVTNTGSRAGCALVQLYASAPGLAVERPVRALVGFGRARLEPGATETVAIALPARELGYYDAQTAAWRVELGVYELAAGASSRELPLTAQVRVR